MNTAHSATSSLATTLPWYAIQTRPRHEKRVAERLHMQSLETFLPAHRCRHKWNNGVTADLELPLFPCYLFARMAICERLRFLQVPGVVGFAASTSHPNAIPDEEIADLRRITESVGAQPHPFLNIGDRVHIVAGPLTGMEGILIRHKQGYRVVVSIEIIMRSVAVEVSEFEIDRVPGSGRRAAQPLPLANSPLHTADLAFR